MILPINRSLVAARVERISSARAPEMCPLKTIKENQAGARLTVIWSTQSARHLRLGSKSACGLADSNLVETADRFLHSSLSLIA